MRCKVFFLFLLLTGFQASAQWKPVEGHIKTPWADEVTPDNVLSEYPRPQMKRGQWMNLNGLWQYGITAKDADGFKPQGEILVPFCLESSLSGVGGKLGKDEDLWYERTFQIPSSWKGKDVLLHFGAVDWLAEVWVNGQRVGEHTGGYSPFCFNITGQLNKKGPQTIRVRVHDESDLRWQPRGKQVTTPKEIWYTAVSGIWQTVWLEPVNKSHIDTYYVVADPATSSINVEVDAVGLKEQDKLVVELLDGSAEFDKHVPSTVICTAEVLDGKAVINIPDAQKWTPDHPYLYGLNIKLMRGRKQIDKVEGYAALRSIAMKDVPIGRLINMRFMLNDEPIIMFGPLDQGYWPDGLYTAPTDEALRFDILKTKQWGWNMTRKHVKVEPARWYWWCDVMGLMVWQDMPNIGDHSLFRYLGWIDGERGPELRKAMTVKYHARQRNEVTDSDVPQEWKDNYYKEWSEIISFCKVFPSVVVWVPFNEAWGQFDSNAVSEFTKKQDPTRLVNQASGGNFHFGGDIVDFHHYPFPSVSCSYFDERYIFVIGEYGGLGYSTDGHRWQTDEKTHYSDGGDTPKEIMDTYEDYARALEYHVRFDRLAAAVYTELTDVENELNGIMSYDRKVVKFDEERLRRINKQVTECLH